MKQGKTWRKRFLAAAGSAGLIVCGAAEVRAEMLHTSTVPAVTREADTQTARFVPQGAVRTPTISHAREDWSLLLRGLRGEWVMMREELTRSVVEATLTAFFIRSAPPPSLPPPPPSALGVPPPQSNGETPTTTVLTPPPPPPQGSGDPGTINPPPPFDPGSPQGAPEPSSLVVALLGAGLLAGYDRRRRRAAR